MELTLNNLLHFLKEKYSYGDDFHNESKLREENRECPIDGDDALELLQNLRKEFNVSFENFDFHQYFLEESELNTMTLKHLFSRKKQREIAEELTIQKLYDYMLCNKKSPN
jgi:gluconate kinase